MLRGGLRFDTRQGQWRALSLRNRFHTGSGDNPVSYPMGTGGSFPVVKKPRREGDHSSPSSAEVKNAWSYTSTPTLLYGVVRTQAQDVFVACCLIQHRDNFTFYVCPHDNEPYILCSVQIFCAMDRF
jgi:hypothetical protein